MDDLVYNNHLFIAEFCHNCHARVWYDFRPLQNRSSRIKKSRLYLKHRLHVTNKTCHLFIYSLCRWFRATSSLITGNAISGYLTNVPASTFDPRVLITKLVGRISSIPCTPIPCRPLLSTRGLRFHHINSRLLYHASPHRRMWSQPNLASSPVFTHSTSSHLMLLLASDGKKYRWIVRLRPVISNRLSEYAFASPSLIVSCLLTSSCKNSTFSINYPPLC
ncbi:hypothetical protein BX070DRAFT_221156 [Coemansia spiralis]|nr:hypothetical protein BX070DRAFT_221156 [Coemansia spiralis]